MEDREIMNGNGMKKETGGQDSPQCGTANLQCGTVNMQCGTANPQCGTANPQCGTINTQSGTASPQSGTTGLLEDLAAGLECMYLSDLRYGYSQSVLRFVLPHMGSGEVQYRGMEPGGRIYHGNGLRLSGRRGGEGSPCGIFKEKG